MKLRNKKTGEIINSKELLTDEFINDMFSRDFDYFNSKLHKIQDEWEDYEEPKEYWYYDTTKNGVDKITHLEDKEKDQEIGNYFLSREEAEKAVEKLKAWKRLKEAGFIINRWNGNLGGGDHYDCCGQVNITAEVGDEDKRDIVKSDLDLLFGGEE